MGFKDATKKMTLLGSGAILAILGYLLGEGWIMVTAKHLGFIKGSLFVSAITVSVCWVVVYLLCDIRFSAVVRNWFKEKEAILSHKAKMAVEGGKFAVIANTAIFISPTLAAVLMVMLGIEGRRLYAYAALGAVSCSVLRCAVYCGVFWGAGKLFS